MPVHQSHKTPPYVTIMVTLSILAASGFTLYGFHKASKALEASCSSVADSFNTTSYYMVESSAEVKSVASLLDVSISEAETALLELSTAVVGLNTAVSRRRLEGTDEAVSAFNFAQNNVLDKFDKAKETLLAKMTGTGSNLKNTFATTKKLLVGKLVETFKSFFVSAKEGSSGRQLGEVFSSLPISLDRVSDLMALCDSVKEQVATIKSIVSGVSSNATVR